MLSGLVNLLLVPRSHVISSLVFIELVFHAFALWVFVIRGNPCNPLIICGALVVPPVVPILYERHSAIGVPPCPCGTCPPRSVLFGGSLSAPIRPVTKL